MAIFHPAIGGISDANFNPKNIQHIPAVKILTRFDLQRNWTVFKGLSQFRDLP
jgi:hypothetical protein